MDRRNNPFAPGAGLQPPELAGRDRLLEDVTIDMDRVLQRRPTKGLVLLGLRGVGKTVLLNRLRAFADDKGFETTKIEAPEGGALPDLLAPELRRILYALDIRQAGGRHLRRAVSVLRGFANAFKVKIGDIEFSVEPAPGEGDSGNLEQDLPRLLMAVAEAAAERRSAVGLFIDEIQFLSSVELAAVVVTCHEIAQTQPAAAVHRCRSPAGGRACGQGEVLRRTVVRLSRSRTAGFRFRPGGHCDTGPERGSFVR